MDSSAIILGFTGPIASGCSFVSKGLSEQFPHLQYFKVSSIIRKILREEGIEEPTVEQMQIKGNELRKSHSESYLVDELINQINSDPRYKNVNEIIIDGIKNENEVKYLRFYSNFYLFSVHADKAIRCDRSVDRIVDSPEEFEQIDKRDELENETYGQQVKKCDYLSDIILLNNVQIRDYPSTPKRDFLSQIYNRYVSRMMDLRVNNPSPDYRPTVDEMAMTSAYVFSKMSSCMKRKVGCVVLDNRGIGASNNQKDGKEITSMPFVVSSGFNEVPLGSKPCMFEYGMCYRDFLQQEYAPKIRHCPNCGQAFEVKVECYRCKKEYNAFIKMCPDCHMELSPKVVCEKCGMDIYKEFLPGAKMAIGKLLDVCRALHAEENALLALVKSSGNSSENLVLYTTTQPCNLCANKIVASGIKNIVYAEPYFMQSSEDILKSGGVDTKRFEGVKSSAFFKLYQ